MNALGIVLPVGLAAFIAALVIGYTHVSLQPGADCGSAFGGFKYSQDTSFYVACAPLLSEKDTSATASLWLGIGLLVSSAALYWANLSPAAKSPMRLMRRGPLPPSPPPDVTLLARMIPAASIPMPYGGPENRPVHPSVFASNG